MPFTIFGAIVLLLMFVALGLVLGMIVLLVTNASEVRLNFGKICIFTTIIPMIVAILIIHHNGISFGNRVDEIHNKLNSEYHQILEDEDYPCFLQKYSERLEAAKEKWWNKLTNFSKEDIDNVHDAYCRISYDSWKRNPNAYDAPTTDEERMNDEKTYELFCKKANNIVQVKMERENRRFIFKLEENVKRNCQCGNCFTKVSSELVIEFLDGK